MEEIIKDYICNFIINCKMIEVLVSNYKLIIELATVCTTIFTAFLLKKQLEINKDALMYQKAVSQPLFNISYDREDSDGDGKYENEILLISNEGEKFRDIKNVSITTIFEIVHNKNHSLYKINGYFYYYTTYHNVKGLIYRCLGYNNKLKFIGLYNETINKTRSNGINYCIYKFDLIKINYVDINNVDRVDYFRNNHKIDESEYNNFLSQIVNKNDILDIDKITLNDLLCNDAKNAW